MQVHLPPLSSSAQAGRAAVREFLDEVDRTVLTEDALLVMTELVGNAVLHARTEMTLSLELHGAGVRISLTDLSHVLPHWSPSSPTSLSGRGLPLVARLSESWGAEALPDGGKRVWAQIDTPSALTDTDDAEDLMELWTDEPWPVEAESAVGVDFDLDIDVQKMLDSRAHTEDLVRDLQLTLLSAGEAADAGTATDDETTLVGLARQVDTANEQFHDARRQMLDQTVAAARRHQTQATLHLRLQPTDVRRARRWLEALDEADRLTAAGTLLLPPFPAEMTAFRRQYIGAIIERLTAA